MNTNRTLTRLFLTCAFALSGTYSLGQAPAWEGYDDFSGASLNATKWDTAIFDGGNHPVVSDGQLLFTGNAPSGSSQSVATQRMLATNSNAASMLADGTEPHSVLEFKESDSLKGIELTLSLPSAVPQKMGFGLYAINYVAQFNATNEEEAERAIRFDIDLWYDSGNPVIEFQVKDPQTGVETDVKVPIQFDQSYRVGFVRDETTIKFYLNDELKGEFPYQNVGETFIVRAMNENGQSFSTSVNNVRVLRNWEDYDDFNDNSLDAAKWATGYWPGAQAPKETNGRIELSGTGINSGTKHPNFFNDLFSAGMPSNGTHHSILALQESEFLGIEAELTLPATNTFGSGVYLGIMEKINSTSIGFVGPELGLWGSTPSLSFENSVYENGNEVVDEDLDKVAALGQSYRVSIVKYGDKYRLYLDDELIKEYPVRGTTAYFHFAAFHDQDQPFTAYVDNVRVLRNSSVDLSRGLVAHYPFEGNSSDVSGHGNHATVYGGASLGIDRHGMSGKAYSFDGDGDYLSANLANALRGTELTISAWVNMLYPGVGGRYPFIIHAKGAENAETFSMGIESDWVEVWGAGRSLYFSESRRLNSGQWAMLTASLNEDALSYYVNGQLNETTSAGTAKSLDLSNISIGAREGNDFWNGSIDEVRIYDRALTAAEVAALYELEKPVSSDTPDSVTVVSTPDGKPIVVKVGDAYKWNSTLDGVTLWSVDDSGHDWQKITMKFENSRNTGDEGFYDSLTGQQPYDNPYVIDENGYVKVTETNGFQYYNVASVENGVIATLEGSAESVVNNGTNPIDQWFFTTRAAAEEFYASKATPPDLAVSPGRIDGHRDQVYAQGKAGPVHFPEWSEINFDLELPTKPNVTEAELTVDGTTYNLLSKQAPAGFRTEVDRVWETNVELYDVESIGVPDLSSLVNGKSFAFRFVADGHPYSYTHQLPPVSAYPEVPAISIGEDLQWKTGTTAGSDHLAIEADKNYTVSWNAFSSGDAGDYIGFCLVDRSGDDDIEILKAELSVGQTSYVIPSTYLNTDKDYEIQVGFFNHTQEENPSGFTHAVGTDSSKPLLLTYAANITLMTVKTLPAATKGWLWFDEYPWVYSDEEKGWLYFKPSGDKIHYYSVRDKAWREFTPKQP
jgi:hypothetical protein